MATQNNNIRYPNVDDEEDKLAGFDLPLAEPVPQNASDGFNGQKFIQQNTPKLNAPTFKPKSVSTPSVSKPQTTTPAPSEELSPTEQILKAAYERGLKENPIETEEQKKKRIRRDRARSIISGIADMGSALSNLYFTTQGAPSTNQSPTMTAQNSARMEKAKAERDKTLQNHLNYALNLNKMEQDRADRNYKQWWQQKTFAVTEARENRLKQESELRNQLMEQKIDKATYEAEMARIKAEYDERIEKGKVALGEAKVKTEEAKQNSYQSTADKNNRTDPNGSKSKGSQGKSYGSLTFGGVTTDYATKPAYEEAIMNKARELKIPTEKLNQPRTIRDILADINQYYKNKPQSTTSSTPKAPASSQSNAKTSTSNSGGTTGRKHAGLTGGSSNSNNNGGRKHAGLK